MKHFLSCLYRCCDRSRTSVTSKEKKEPVKSSKQVSQQKGLFCCFKNSWKLDNKMGKTNPIDGSIKKSMVMPKEITEFYEGLLFRIKVPRGVTPGSLVELTIFPRRLFSLKKSHIFRFKIKFSHDMQLPQYVYIRIPKGSFNGNTYVCVPKGIRPGQKFLVTIHCQDYSVTCPEGVRPGRWVRMRLPPSHTNFYSRMSCHRKKISMNKKSSNEIQESNQFLEVEIPIKRATTRGSQFVVRVGGIKRATTRGSQFVVRVGGVPLLVTYPTNTNNLSTTRTLKFKIPSDIRHLEDDKNNKAVSDDIINVGWTRLRRAHDLKFQWVYLDMNGNVC